MALEEIFIEFINNLIAKTGNRHPVTMIELDERLYEDLENEVLAKLRHRIGTIEPMTELRFQHGRGYVSIIKSQI